MKILLTSKRTAFALAILICSTGLCAAGFVTGEQWADLAKILIGAVVVGHTVSHAVDGGAFQRSQVPDAIVVNAKNSSAVVVDTKEAP